MEHLQWLMPYLERYSYGAIFMSTLLDGLFIPAPSQLLLISAGLMAARGNMNIYLVLLAAWSGMMVGSFLGYLLGHSAGQKWLLHHGKRLKIINPSHLARVEHYFHHYGSGLMVVFARFIDPLRQLISFIAGALGMPFWQFIFYTLLGTTLWTGIWGIGAYLLGEHVTGVLALIKKTEPYITALGVGVLLAALLYLLWRWRRQQ
jgi:membrane protein DedA with SNARE-associated domain